MNRAIIWAVAVAGFCQVCSASVCATGTLASYVGLGSTGCTVGTNTLFNFQPLAGTAGASEIPVSNVVLSPLGGSMNPGLDAAVNVNSATGVVQEVLFTFQLSGNSYTGSSAVLSGASETGDGAVTGLKNICAGGSFGSDGVSGCTGTPAGLVTVDGAQNMDSTTFKSVSLLSVTDDLTVDGGTVGSAAGGSLANQFTATPEPGGLLLTAVGMALVAGRWYKFHGRGFGDRKRTL